MGKKQYIAPKIIDLSIERITGVGAGNCLTGGQFTTSYCHHGHGTTGKCEYGNGASAGCTSGDLPYQSGVLCKVGGGAGTICDDGGSASGAFGKCSNGSSATGYCLWTGSAALSPSVLCTSGDSQLSLDSS
nr:hypothetical protein [uncultured Methanospirillum sp.]